MRLLTDLDPRDRDMRLALRDSLVARRLAKGLSQDRLAARLGIDQAAVSLVETGESWRLVTVQRWCRALGWNLSLRPNWAGGEDPAVDAFRPVDPDRADAWDQAALADALRVARIAVGMTQAQVGQRLGTGDQAVRHIEKVGNGGLLFMTPQRYCRALGGYLVISTDALADRRVAA